MIWEGKGYAEKGGVMTMKGINVRGAEEAREEFKAAENKSVRGKRECWLLWCVTAKPS